MVIFLANTASGIKYGKKGCHGLKMAAILKNANISNTASI